MAGYYNYSLTFLFDLKPFVFAVIKSAIILNGHVFVMLVAGAIM